MLTSTNASVSSLLLSIIGRSRAEITLTETIAGIFKSIFLDFPPPCYMCG